jgi:predicted DCC family thiol-disulfide oxidoreductase YuxK
MPTDNVIFFDGVCKFCNASVNFALKHNSKKHLFFSPLQSNFATTTLKPFGYDVTQVSSVVFLKDGKIYTQSSGAFAICKELDWPWKVVYIFIFVPKFIRDFFYNFIAKRRYQWFGKLDTCRVPSAAERERFLE